MGLYGTVERRFLLVKRFSKDLCLSPCAGIEACLYNNCNMSASLFGCYRKHISLAFIRADEDTPQKTSKKGFFWTKKINVGSGCRYRRQDRWCWKLETFYHLR
jgi:hypothetical protein